MDDSLRADLRAFGLRVQQLRHERGWSQAELAGFAGLDRSYLAQIEAGKRNTGVGTVYRLAQGLGVEPAVLFSAPSAPARRSGRSRSDAPG